MMKDKLEIKHEEENIEKVFNIEHERGLELFKETMKDLCKNSQCSTVIENLWNKCNNQEIGFMLAKILSIATDAPEFKRAIMSQMAIDAKEESISDEVQRSYM